MGIEKTTNETISALLSQMFAMARLVAEDVPGFVNGKR
jgi:hypothetical protein